MSTRKPKQKPWEVEGNPWGTESKFVVWVRGVLRKGWSKYPLKIAFKNSKRIRIKNTNKRSSKRFPEVWAIHCENCGEVFRQEQIEVDHIGEQGTFTKLEDVKGYVEHLFMLTYEDMRCVCKKCHKTISYSQRTGMTFERAAQEKKVIEVCKLPVKNQLAILKDFGYNNEQCSNQEKRRKLLTDLVIEGKIK